MIAAPHSIRRRGGCRRAAGVRRKSRRLATSKLWENEMETRTASCRCGKLLATCTGAPVRVSVCHCLACQQRSGSVFAAQARWTSDRVSITGERQSWTRTADSGRHATYSFCPTCGSTVAYTNESWPDLIAIPVGAFADPSFPPPRFSVWENRKHGWVEIAGDDVTHSSPTSPSDTARNGASITARATRSPGPSR